MLNRCLIILNAQNLYLQVQEYLLPYFKHYQFNDTDMECCYDWMIIEAVLKTYNLTMCGHVNKDRFVLQDIYACIYDDIGYRIEGMVRELITGSYGIHFSSFERIKLLVTFDEVIIVRNRIHI